MSRLDGNNLPEVSFLTGSAGTGKTFTILSRVAENKKYGKVAATTGIAAVNLDAVTINSVLKYFDTASLEDLYVNGRLHKRLKELQVEDGFERLIIDEVSMMDGAQLDCIYQALEELHDDWADEGKGHALGLTLTGDFCQLPPVKAKWAFEAACWPQFNKSVERLTKVWRQGDPSFLEALNYARSGMGEDCADVLRQTGKCNFTTSLDLQFDGTTIMAKNEGVDRYNRMRLLQLPTPAFSLTNDRWGSERAEWKNIPDSLILKEGALVMILTNESVNFEYVNGDLGTIVDSGPSEADFHWDDLGPGRKPGWMIDPVTGNERLGIRVELKRHECISSIPKITRYNEAGEPPKEYSMSEIRTIPHWSKEAGQQAPWGEVSYEEDSKKYILGAVNYYPVRLAYASTVHKTQGLSLDTIQIDLSDQFFGAPGMCYVALSRARRLEGIKFRGSLDQLARRIKIDERVRPWL